MSFEFNKTYTKIIENLAFGDLQREELIELLKDGRIFSHYAERVLAKDFSLKHIGGCEGHDLERPENADVKFDQKTFTDNGCKFMPSNMIGQGRKFDEAVFIEKSKKLIYVVVSNVKFPEIKIRFVKGEELAKIYPTGAIQFKDHDKFFND